MFMKWESNEDVDGNHLLTNFSNDALEIYQEAINRYPKSEEYGLFIKLNHATDVNGNPLRGHYHSIWRKKEVSDLSDFWNLHSSIRKDIEKKILRRKKLERIL